MPVSEAIALLEGRLRRGLSRFVGRLVLAGLLRALTVGAAAALAAVVAGAAFARSPQLALPLAVAAALAVIGALAWFVLAPWARRPGLAGFARLAEGRLPALRSLLVNALELAPVASGQRRAADGTSPELAAAALAQAEERSRAVDFGRLAPAALPRGWGRPLLVVLALWVAGFAVAPGALWRSGWGLLHPRAVLAAGVTLAVWPGDVTLAPGAALSVGARVRGSEAAPELVYRSLGLEHRVRMRPGAPPERADAGGGSAVDPGGEGAVYRAEVSAIAAPGTYAVEVSGLVSPRYRVTLAGSATPVSFAVTYRYPAYTRLPGETQAATRADLVALSGTRATVVVNLDRGVDDVTWTLGSRFRRDGERRWVGETTLDHDGPYELALHSGDRVERFTFRTEAVPDRPPLLEVTLPAGDLDLPAGQRIPIAVSASDDFGLTELSLAYDKSDGTGGRVRLAHWADEPHDATAQTGWDAGPLGLLPGESAGFVLEVRDNDRVSGPHVTRSARFVVRFPTLSEVYDRIEDRQATAAEQMDKALDQARELAKQVEEVKRDLQPDAQDRQGEASWEKRQSAKAAAERQQEISERMQEITRQLEEATQQASERQAFREDVLAKMQEISKLVAELQTPELKDAIRRLQEALSEVDPRKLQANLQKLQNAQDELMKGLERTLELLKRVRQEEQLHAAAERARELARREQAMQRTIPDARSAEERERAAAAQEQAQREAERLQKDLEELSRDLRGGNQPQPAEQAAQSAQTLAQQASPALQQSAQQMRQSMSGAAGRSAAQAQQAFEQVAQQIEQTAQAMNDGGQRQLQAAVRRSAQDLVDLSQRQEDALDERGEPARRAQRQQDLREGAERVADDLVDMAKQTPFMPPDAQRSLGQALDRLGRSEQAFSNGAQSEGEMMGRAASASLNQAVVDLRQAEKSMCKGGTQSGGQSPSPTAGQMQGLTGQQGQLNEDTQGMIERLTRQQRLAAGDQGALEDLAARQEAIRRGIEETLQNQREGEVLGRLDEAKRDMDEVARDLRQGRATDEVAERQNRILSRLLDAQRSVNRREFDNQRESRSGQDVARASPAELPRSLTELRDRAQRDLLRARAERYPAEYRDLVESYLRKLQEGP